MLPTWKAGDPAQKEQAHQATAASLPKGWEAVTEAYPLVLNRFPSLPNGRDESDIRDLANRPATAGALVHATNPNSSVRRKFTWPVTPTGKRRSLRAALAQATGIPAESPCDHCATGKGLWSTCYQGVISPSHTGSGDWLFKGACASCYFHGVETKCTLYGTPEPPPPQESIRPAPAMAGTTKGEGLSQRRSQALAYASPATSNSPPAKKRRLEPRLSPAYQPVRSDIETSLPRAVARPRGQKQRPVATFESPSKDTPSEVISSLGQEVTDLRAKVQKETDKAEKLSQRNLVLSSTLAGQQLELEDFRKNAKKKARTSDISHQFEARNALLEKETNKEKADAHEASQRHQEQFAKLQEEVVNLKTQEADLRNGYQYALSQLETEKIQRKTAEEREKQVQRESRKLRQDGDVLQQKLSQSQSVLKTSNQQLAQLRKDLSKKDLEVRELREHNEAALKAVEQAQDARTTASERVHSLQEENEKVMQKLQQDVYKSQKDLAETKKASDTICELAEGLQDEHDEWVLKLRQDLDASRQNAARNKIEHEQNLDELAEALLRVQKESTERDKKASRLGLLLRHSHEDMRRLSIENQRAREEADQVLETIEREYGELCRNLRENQAEAAEAAEAAATIRDLGRKLDDANLEVEEVEKRIEEERAMEAKTWREFARIYSDNS